MSEIWVTVVAEVTDARGNYSKFERRQFIATGGDNPLFFADTVREGIDAVGKDVSRSVEGRFGERPAPRSVGAWSDVR